MTHDCGCQTNENSETSYYTNVSDPSRLLLNDIDKQNHSFSFDQLNDLRIKNVNRIVIGYININSITNKFDMLFDRLDNNIDILMISETKIDESFPTSQFCIKGYTSPYRLDR